MKKSSCVLGLALLVSGLNVGVAAAQEAAAPSSSKFILPVKPVAGAIPTGIVLTGIRPLIDPPSLGWRPVIDPPSLGFRPVTSPPLRPILGFPSLGILPKPGVLPKPGTPIYYDTVKPVTLSDVKGYDR